MATATQWTWHEGYQGWYRGILDQRNGTWQWEWASSNPITPRYFPIPVPVDASNNISDQTNAQYLLTPQIPAMNQPYYQQQMQHNPTFNQMAEQGNLRRHRRAERLDSSYSQRPSEFFQRGVMFSCLDVEPYTGDIPPQNLPNPSYVTWTYLGEPVFANIRRFVVIEANRGFCHSLPISTYSQRATTKPGVDPGEHAIIYTSAEPPQLLDGEYGIYKPPIRVETDSMDIWLDPRSRINFNIMKPIQHNIKVKYLGKVARSSVQDLIDSWVEERTKRSGVDVRSSRGPRS